MNPAGFSIVDASLPVVDSDPRDLPDQRGEFGASYRAALVATESSPAVHAVVAGRERRALALLAAQWQAGDFTARYGLKRLLSVGSTRRDLYGQLPVDFDLMVETEVPQDRIDRDHLRPLLLRLTEQIAAAPEFRPLPEEGVQLEAVTLASFKLHGQGSLVGRLDAILEQNDGVKRRFPLVDITFGNLARTANYALWMDAFFARLPSDLARRQKQEIRLAKRLFKALGVMYGLAETGLGSIAIEQWVLQGPTRISCGIPVGTLDGLLRHVAGAGDAHSSFADYARRWPVWRPGCSDDEIPTGQIRPGINLLDAGAFGEATDPWWRIVAMAGRYVRLRAENAARSPETLAGHHV